MFTKKLKGEKIMRRERLGFKCDEGLIIKSPETGIAAKVELQKDGTAVVGLMKWTEVMELEMQVKEEEEKPAKKKIIAVMLLFYLAIIRACIFASGVTVGLGAALYFIAITFAAIYFLLQQIIYAVKHKENVQYKSIFRKIDTCYMLGMEINEANIKNITFKPEISDRMDIDKIRQIFLAMAITPLILLVSYVNIIAILVMDAVILVIYITSIKNERLLDILNKTNEFLIYRKPTEQQIENVLFGFNYLKECEQSEVARWFYFR